ncbi:MAG: nucleotidyltransferase domain-containing protein [Streptosporangiaceae bacterium]
MEFPGDVDLVLERLREGLVARADLVGMYVYGSLVTGDFSPARSDIDVVVVLDRESDEAAVGELGKLHAEVARSGGAAWQLHCLYVAAEHASDPERLCTYWFGDRMTQWQMKIMTQAELASVGVALHGPWPPPGIGPVPVADIQAAVLAEMRGYWRRFARKRKRWLDDDSIDHALIVLPRAEAVLVSGDLITKGEAISRLADFGIPAALAQEIQRRRAGHEVTLSTAQRLRRGYRARRIMQRGVRRLSRLDPQERLSSAANLRFPVLLSRGPAAYVICPASPGLPGSGNVNGGTCVAALPGCARMCPVLASGQEA